MTWQRVLRLPLRSILGVEPQALVLRATALVALVNAPSTALRVIGVALALVVWSDDARLRSPWPWFVAALAALAWDAANWHGLDDHIPLTHYWLLAIGCSLCATDSAQALERNARALIGLTFLFAVASKVAWGDFVSGRFYRAMMLIDDRTSWVASLAGIDQPSANYDLVQRTHVDGLVTLDGGTRSVTVAAVLVVGTFLVEGALAITYLAPLGPRSARARTFTLIAFCVATYAIVPVAGFGSLLLVMAAAERRLGNRQRLAHLLGPPVLIAWFSLWSALQP